MSRSSGDGSVNILQDHAVVSPAIHRGLIQRGKKRSHHYMGRNEIGRDDPSDELFNASEKKRGLTTDQINFLETSFNIDLKLDPERKALIAEQLGLRPRQVAIWFQNRRARWKNKQLEQDYEALKASYEAVVKEKESILKEQDLVTERNKALQAEVTRLTTLLRSMESGNMSGSICTGSVETWQDKEHSTGKPELMSPNKSVVDQSEMQDSGQSILTPSGTMNIVTTDLSIEEFDSALRPDLESPFLESIFTSLPLMVQQLVVNGYSLEDAYCRFLEWEDQFGGFAWCE